MKGLDRFIRDHLTDVIVTLLLLWSAILGLVLGHLVSG
jgi:hypothetical protein